MKTKKFIVLIISLFLISCLSAEEKRDNFYQKAKEYFQSQNYNDARIEIKNALKIDPKFARGYELLALIALDKKDWRGAFENFSRAVNLDENLSESQFNLAKILLSANQLDRAKEKIDLLLKLDPDNEEAKVLHAIYLGKKRQVGEAEQILKDISASNPQNLENYILLAGLYQTNGRTDLAEQSLLQGLKEDPSNKQIIFNLAKFYTKQNKLNKAEEYFLILKEHDDSKQNVSKILLVDFYLQQNKLNKAKNILIELLDNEPENDKIRMILASTYYKQRKFDYVENILQSGLQIKPNNIDMILALSKFYINTGQDGKGISLLKQSIAQNMDNSQIVRLRNALAKTYQAQNKIKQAEKEYNLILQRDPRNPDALFFQGQRLMARNRVKEAVSKLRQVVNLEPGFIPAYIKLAEAYYHNSEIQLSKDTLSHALKVNNKFYPARKALASIFVGQKDYPAALEHLEILHNQNPNKVEPLILMGDVYVLNNELKKASDAYLLAEQVSPNNPIVLLKQAQVLAQEKKFGQAHQKLDQALKITPNAISIVKTKVAFYFAQNQMDNSLKFCNKLIRKFPNVPYLYALRGKILTAMKKISQAEQSYNQAIKLAPKWLLPYYKISQLYIAQGKINDGIKKLKKAVQVRPDSIQTRFSIALLYQLKKQYVKAAQEYENILRINKEFAVAANNLAYIYAENLSSEKNLKRALSLAQMAAKNNGPEGLDTLGWVQHKLGQNEVAIKTLLKAYEMKKDKNPTIAYHLGMIYYKMINKVQARHWLQIALNLNKLFPEKNKAKEILRKIS